MLHGKVKWSVNGTSMIPINKIFGDVPIMVKSDRCHLRNLKPAELIQHNEHEDEWGGYFILSGHERLIRMLLITRRNYPIAVSRKSWKGRGQMFSDKGILLRSVADDETSVNNTLHYVNDGTAKLMFIYRKRLYYMPLCLVFKCLLNVTDVYIYKKVTQGYDNDLYFKSCIRNMLHMLHVEGLDSHQAARNFVGKTFRVKFTDFSDLSDEEICDYILRNCIAVHLSNHEDKFNLLVFMTQKLFSFVRDDCCLEGSDAVMFQEVLTGGSVYQQVLSDKLQGYLLSLKLEISKKLSSGKEFTLNQLEMANIIQRARNIGNSMKNFLATGNVNTRFLTGLPQDKGLTIVVENINRMRYMAHFKSIHRGAYFTTMRTSEPRALLPDSWGFICPVHTPDGAPCGLLNHLTKDCQVTAVPDEELVKNIPKKLYSFGVVHHNVLVNTKNNFIVLVDGKVIGFLPEANASQVVNNLRMLKVEGEEIPATTEIVFVPKKGKNSQFPGLFIFTTPGRLVRQVKNLALNKVELIGTFEQVYLDICIKSFEAYPGRTSHQERSETSFLSNLASLIPMPDCNQSPRNIYQCQMGKQSMGTPCHTWDTQAETKLYRLLFPSSPLFRPAHYDIIELDNFPMGINAVVAVVSYTGYDMEDAMIINKSSFERGFGHGCIIKSEFVELTKESYFERDPSRMDLAHLGEDGLVEPGCQVKEGDPLYCYYDKTELKYVVQKSHMKELAYVDNVRQFENDQGRKGACITFRIPRNPAVGDKFASRAGQKGICSQLWAAADLPFTDTGMVPDIIFNPHGFPSRMTIAMMIELMAGKSAAVEGTVYDATPFKFSQDNTAINYFGRMLEAAGYSYYGTEKMYSGTTGKDMEADIFFGIVYYQRLRHMVLDKWQVRSTGPVDSVTQQPVQGRKRGGGIRVGEMERDALISHGVSALINDRLLDCSDRFKTLVCRTCNCLLSANVQRCMKSGGKTEVCRKCTDGGKICVVEIPYILRYLLVQFAAFNINVQVQLN
ncbi:UNVERIFIED_CONTAM: hypothetical protein PYX00_005060 [Menopon gallinae]